MKQRLIDTMRKHITKCPQRSCWSMEKTVMCMHEGEKTSSGTSTKINPEPPTVYTDENALWFASFPSYRCITIISVPKFWFLVRTSPICVLNKYDDDDDDDDNW